VTIVSEACAINVLLALALAQASVISCNHNLERHLLMTLQESFMIVMCL
jgi:hypothetical protein